MGFIETYKKVLLNESINYLSRITTILIVVALLTDILRDAYFYFLYAEKQWIDENLEFIVINKGFLTLICIVFFLRFVFLWFKESKFVWSSQITWLSGWLVILVYRLVTVIFYPSLFSFSDSFYSEYFVWSRESTAFWLLAYLYLSPIKQILVFIFSLLANNKKNYRAFDKLK